MKLIYITVSNSDDAAKISRTLITEQLAACANIIPSISSIYRWNGVIEESTEALLIIKTSDETHNKTVERIRELHSYDCPCIISLNPADVNKAYADWVVENCK